MAKTKKNSPTQEISQEAIDSVVRAIGVDWYNDVVSNITRFVADPRLLLECNVQEPFSPRNNFLNALFEAGSNLQISFLWKLQHQGFPITHEQAAKIICFGIFYGTQDEQDWSTSARHHDMERKMMKGMRDHQQENEPKIDFDKAYQFIYVLQSHLEKYGEPVTIEEVRGFYKKHFKDEYRVRPHHCPDLADELLKKRIKDGTNLRYSGLFGQDGYKKADFLKPDILALVIEYQRLEQINYYLETYGDETIESDELLPLVMDEIAGRLTNKFNTAQELFDACIEKTEDPRSFFSCDVSRYKSPYNRLTDALLEEKPKIILDYLNLCKTKDFPFPRDTISKMMCHALLYGDAVIKGQDENYRDFKKSFQAADALQDYLREHETPVTLKELRTLHQKTCPESTAHVDLSEKVLDAAIRGQFLNERYFTDFFQEQAYQSGDFTKREETLAAIVHSGYFGQVNIYLKTNKLEPVDFVPLLQPNIKSYVLDEKLLKHVTAYLDTTEQPLTVQFVRESLGQENVPLSAVFKEAFSERGQDRTGTLSEKQITQLFGTFTKNGDTVDLDDFYFGVKESLWGGSSADHNKTLFDTVGGAEKILKDDDCLIQLTRDPNAILFLQKVWASVPEDQREALQDTYTKAFNSAFAAQALRQREMFSASSR
jgi:hypothetical protein